jgi:uncharacterized repeat protein (TIGR01451 family)
VHERFRRVHLPLEPRFPRGAERELLERQRKPSARNARALRGRRASSTRLLDPPKQWYRGGFAPGGVPLPRVLADPRGRYARVAWLLVFLLTAPRAWALGTPAGTTVANTATVAWTVGPGSNFTQSSTTQFVVDELVNVVVTLQTVSPVSVTSPDTNRQLTFLVSNTGNGSEAFSLLLDPAQAGDQFDPTNARIYLDTNGSTTYEPGVDPLYQPGVNDPVVAADGARMVFALCDIPPARVNGDLGNATLRATSLTGTGPGTIVLGAGTGGGDAVIGAGGGTSVSLAGYLVADLAVSIAKSAVVLDVGGGSVPAPGSRITYTLQVNVTGTGNVANLVITDPLPPFTTYVANSLLLNGAALSDGVDADAGDFGGTAANRVTVTLGSVAGGSLPRTINFAVTIN